MPSDDRPVVLGKGEGTTIEGPAGGPLTFKLRGAQTEGALTAFENVIAPGDGPPLHTHEREGESWYVIEGSLRFKLDGELRRASAGSFVYVPPGVPHCFQNVGDAPARILVLFAPAGMEAFFDRFSTLPSGTADPEVFASLGRDVGMNVVGPPLAVSDPP